MKFKTPYANLSRHSLLFEGCSLTEQDHKDECDIGKIIESYVRTGQLPSQSQPSYLDCTQVQDYESAQYLIAEVNSQFNSLPAVDRERFVNVKNFLNFVSDPANLRECYEKNYINRDTVDISKVYPERYTDISQVSSTPATAGADVTRPETLVETASATAEPSKSAP